MKVLVCDPIADEGIALLRQHAHVDVRLGLSQEELSRTVQGYSGIVVRSQTYIGAEVIAAADALQVIGRAGVGVDNIDVGAAGRHGVVVVNAPTANNIAAAEHTIAMMLSLARRIPQANAAAHAGESNRSGLLGVEVRGKTLGIVGLGNIGSEVARRARSLEMSLIGFDPFVSADYADKLGIALVSLEDLLKVSDFVTVHVPLTTSTRAMIGREQLAAMKPGSRIVNCARGGIVDEEALLEAIRGGHVAGAALDVFAKEPPLKSPLLHDDRIVVTPHLGGSTEEAQVGVAVDVAQQVISVLQGQPAQYAVNAPAFGAEALSVLGSHLVLAERLGSLLGQLADTPQPQNELEITYSGEMCSLDTTPVKAAVVKGLLLATGTKRVTLMNAMMLASNRGLQIVEKRSPECIADYSSLITLRVPSADFVSEISGTVVQGEPHVVRLNNYWVDIAPTETEGYLLLSHHLDKPGVVGRIGTLLGNASINISFMQVGRRQPLGEAMMVLGVDDVIPEAIFDQLLQIAEIRNIRVVKSA